MLKKLSLGFVVVTTIMLLYKGVIYALLTSGLVQGGEFSMLITISNQLAYFMIWLSSVTVYAVVNCSFNNK